jgi:hypothetical protein
MRQSEWAATQRRIVSAQLWSVPVVLAVLALATNDGRDRSVFLVLATLAIIVRLSLRIAVFATADGTLEADAGPIRMRILAQGCKAVPLSRIATRGRWVLVVPSAAWRRGLWLGIDDAEGSMQADLVRNGGRVRGLRLVDGLVRGKHDDDAEDVDPSYWSH